MERRGLRLEVIAGLGVVLLAFLTPAARAQDAQAQTVATATTLTLGSPSRSGATPATVSVAAADGSAASGVVDIRDGARQLDEVVLNDKGEASASLTLPAGKHSLSASYLGGAAYRSSASNATEVQTEDSTAGSTPSFQLSVAPVAPYTLPLTLTAGQSGSLSVTVAPVNNASLTAPMFVTLSCSGLPSQAACSFAPSNVQILSSTPASCAAGAAASACPPTSLLVISTQNKSDLQSSAAGRSRSPMVWAILLPGMLGLGGLAWGARRRRWLQRLALVALLGLAATLGATACSPLHHYYNNGPPPPPATPAGTYTVTITAQSSNGVSAISNSTTMVLTVNAAS